MKILSPGLAGRVLAVALAAAGFGPAAALAASADGTPDQWLDRMVRAVRVTNYEGTVIRTRDGDVEVLKVVRVVADGVVREKMIVQEGDGIEIIRNGNEVHCIIPDKRSVLVEEWNDQSNLFTSLPSSSIRFGSEYDVSIVRSERVAGRKAVVVAIRPHDDLRFGHRIWLDATTGFPLQTRLVGEGGETVEQVKFADINLDADVRPGALAPSVSTENFRWFTRPGRSIVGEVDSAWRSEGLPQGFRMLASHEEKLAGSDHPVTHLLYSDGLANVSVFIEPATQDKPVHRSRVGASSSYSLKIGDHRVTAVGDVPARTVERIATSMQPAP